MILFTLLALCANAWTADNKGEAVIEVRQQWQEVETVVASGAASGTQAVDTTTPYNQIISGRTWGEIIWKVEISVKRNDPGAAHKVTVTVPKAKLHPNHGQDLVTECDATAAYTTCVVEAWPIINPRATITFTIAKATGVAVTAKVKVTGINTGRTVVDNASWTKNLLGKSYTFQGWPDWNVARTECKKQKDTTGVEMCLTSEHSDTERDVVSGLIATKGYPGAWIGQTEAVGLGKWNDVNAQGWRWSDGSDSSYVGPWTITPKAGTMYEGIDVASINSATEGRNRANVILAYAGSAYMILGHCGAQLVNKEWSGMRCSLRWPAVCGPCMASGSTRLEATDLCDNCRLPVPPSTPNAEPQRCYTKEYCAARRPATVFPIADDPTDWGKIVGTTLGVIIPIACFGYCCFYKGNKEDMLDDDEE